MPLTAIRPATAADAARICAIYNPYVAGTTISFEEEPVTPAQIAERIADVQAAGLPWLVLELDGELIGYAYASKWRARPAYRHAVESSIYLDDARRGAGHGKLLYARLIEELQARGLRTVIGGVAMPNDASVRLHEGLGFRKVAHFAEVGYKFGQWLDVAYWQRSLAG